MISMQLMKVLSAEVEKMEKEQVMNAGSEVCIRNELAISFSKSDNDKEGKPTMSQSKVEDLT
jgi:hypothetical protein